MKGFPFAFAFVWMMTAAPAFGMTFGNPVTVVPLSSITSDANQRVVVWDDARGIWAGVLNTGMPDLKVGVWTALDGVAAGLTVDLIVSGESGEQLQPAILATPETTLVAYHANTTVASVPVNVNVEFGAPVVVAQGGASVSTPAIASAGSGHVSLSWASHSAVTDSILVAHSTDTGKSWSAPFSARFPTDPGFYTRSHPAIVRSAPHRPEFVVVWEDSWHFDPVGRHLAAANILETDVVCNRRVGYRPAACARRWSASLASDADGVVFGTHLMEGYGEDHILYGSEEVDTLTALGHEAPGVLGQVQLDMRGETVIVVWERDSKLIVCASFDRGQTWGEPTVITTVSSGTQPFVALRDDGQKALVEYVAPGGFGGVRLVEVMLP